MPNRLSIALVTRNRPESLRRTLESLRAQSSQPHEVVISDDSDADQAAAVRTLAASFDCRYQAGPKLGLYANRNKAADACTGSHVRTMDDDHEFPEHHIAACLEAIDLDPDSVWIIGEYISGQARDSPPDCPGQLHPRGYSVTPPDPQSSWALADGAAILPQRLFDDDRFRYSEIFLFGASYLELGSRLVAGGTRIRHLDTTWILHHYDPAKRSYLILEEDLASRMFAMLCHSWCYQPSARNKLLTATQIMRYGIRHPRVWRRAFPRARKAYRAQRQVFRSGRADAGD